MFVGAAVGVAVGVAEGAGVAVAPAVAVGVGVAVADGVGVVVAVLGRTVTSPLSGTAFTIIYLLPSISFSMTSIGSPF